MRRTTRTLLSLPPSHRPGLIVRLGSPLQPVSAAELTVTGRRARRFLEAINLAADLRISWALQWSDGLSIY